MEKFLTLHAVAAPYPHPNVDTDRIIRIERCARAPRSEMGAWAFEVERYQPAPAESIEGAPENPDFVFNRAPFREARIWVAGENFGCGSSREWAVWALQGMGIRCVIAPSYGEIFEGNCFQNGLLPVRLPAEAVQRLLKRLTLADGGTAEPAMLTVDLQARQVVAWGEMIPFEMEATRRQAMLDGLDDIGQTLQHIATIEAFQTEDRKRRPWVWC
jgi:3-isopropylmalate/(R)-2-methylmalate dehydratase small subunit